MGYNGEAVRGVNGIVTFDGNVVTITRKGLLTRLTLGKGEKRIPLESIEAVEWMAPSAMSARGFVRFRTVGADDLQSARNPRVAAARDENSVLVGASQAHNFEDLRAAVESAIAAR
jgi:hypothetical protein